MAELRAGAFAPATLAHAGIRLRSDKPGTHRAACPECAKDKPRRRDDALSVTVEPGGKALWLCHRCGWKGALGAAGSVEKRPARVVRAPRPAADGPALQAALARFRRALPIEPETPAARYLQARACALPPAGSDLRWSPAERHPSGHTGPALVALVSDAVTCEPLTLHRTWLARDGSAKAELDRSRLLWPGLPKAGGVIRLWPDEEVTLGLCIAEGIETALSAARGFGLGWATIDAGNLAAFPVLGGIEAITIIADHDPAGLAAAETCATRWAKAGREWRIWKAAAHGQDFNDLARGAAA